MVEVYVLFRGKVQGVFFRNTIFEHVQNFSITGYVKNLADGSVEAVFQGSKEDIERLITQIKERPGSATIADIQLSYREQTKKHTEFFIAH